MEHAVRNQLLEDYAQNRGEFTLFDFGTGVTQFPQIVNGAYLTRTVAFVVLRGSDRPTFSETPESLPKKKGEVVDLGSGWFVTPVEIDYMSGPIDLTQAFAEAEALLLKARDEAKIQARSAGAQGA